ncbi:MAG: hypothetical protein HZA59_13070 [Hydrogenophilales bacterium]|nr:hypothetical protein [Hydrogenophilales bacterium]
MSLKLAKLFCYLAALASGLLVSGCATWSTGEVMNVRPTTQEAKQVSPEKILLTEGDISDRPYAVLGDISVTVNKTTIFHAEPTREMVNDKLREEAAKLGADAVTHVRYGTVGISLMSWGSLDGKGRAVSFTR